MENERLWILLAKKKSGEASAQELAELESLLLENNSANYNHEVIEKIWKEPLGFLPEMNLNESTWNSIEAKINSPKKIISISTAAQWIAAAVLLIAVATFILIYQKQPSAKTAAKNITAAASNALSKQNFYLPDGTHVWLHGNSKIVYNKNSFGKAVREVHLIGEAFFDVTKNPKVPFVIHAGVVNITVKGTAFNVKAYPGEKNIETTLLRGLIEITTTQNPNKKIFVKPNQKIIIPANLITEKNQKTDTAKTFAITQVQKNVNAILPETAWIKDKLEFSNETFEELAPEMESWFNVMIQFKNDDLKTKRFSGVIEKETLQQTLQAMQISYHFNYTINDNTVTIQ